MRLASGTIYRIYCTRTRRSYIGKTTRLASKRWNEHIDDLNAGKHPSKNLQHAWRKYGARAFKFTVIETIPFCPQALLDARERHWISRLGYYNGRHRHLYRGILWHWMWTAIWTVFWLLVGVGLHGLVFN